MKPPAVIEVHVTLDASAELRQRNVVLELDVLVFQRPSEPFLFGVVAAPAASVHADDDSELLQFVRELPAGELASLIRIEYLRYAVSAHRELKRLDAMERVHRVHDAVRHVLAAVEVHDGNHERPVPGDSRISDVRRPHLARTFDLQILQKVRILFVFGVRLRRIEMRPWIDGPQTGFPAQTPYAFVIDVIPTAVKLPGDAPNPVKRRFQIDLHDFVLGGCVHVAFVKVLARLVGCSSVRETPRNPSLTCSTSWNRTSVSTVSVCCFLSS